MSKNVNNFFESLTNSTNPRYIQQPPTTTYVAPPPVTYKAPPMYEEYKPFKSTVYKQPTMMYTPPHLRSHFEPLNSSYNSTFYGNK